MAQVPCLGCPYTVTYPAGGTRYVATVRYRVSDCATGDHQIDFECDNLTPPTQCDGKNTTNASLTRIVGDVGYPVIPYSYAKTLVHVPVGTCCDCFECLDDGLNPFCCDLMHPGAHLGQVGATCGSSVCEPDSDECCDDGQFCNGAETVNLATGQCQPGTPPLCPGGSDCVIASCNPAANGGTGACTTQNRPNGTACGSAADTECDNPDTCLNGICQSNFAPAGSPCGSSADTECDNPDSCNASGACLLNLTANGTPCNDGSNCTFDDACNNGVCTGAAQVCDDGLFCTGVETCDALLGCEPGDNPCESGFDCDEAAALCVVQRIPTASTWGLVVMSLAMLIGARVSFRKRSTNTDS
jgi:hypothetical protein